MYMYTYIYIGDVAAMVIIRTVIMVVMSQIYVNKHICIYIYIYYNNTTSNEHGSHATYFCLSLYMRVYIYIYICINIT